MYILNPDRIWGEPWRFLTYGFVHNSNTHLAWNVISQLVIGVPLELTNGWKRVAMIYLSGIVLGGLWRELINDSQLPMAGCSGKTKKD